MDELNPKVSFHHWGTLDLSSQNPFIIPRCECVYAEECSYLRAIVCPFTGDLLHTSRHSGFIAAHDGRFRRHRPPVRIHRALFDIYGETPIDPTSAKDRIYIANAMNRLATFYKAPILMPSEETGHIPLYLIDPVTNKKLHVITDGQQKQAANHCLSTPVSSEFTSSWYQTTLAG